MRTILLAAALILLAAAMPDAAEPRFPAELAGHAILPAATFVAPPEGAPPGLALSGRFTAADGRPRHEPGNIPGMTGPAPTGRPTGLATPFRGQPVQGFSGIAPVAGAAGSWWVVADNGFGNRRNSPDALLMIHQLRPDFAAGTVAIERTLFLSDPDRLVSFHIVTDPSPRRFLTGADFDLESIQPVADGFWLGDEFGPFLIQVDLEGRVRAVLPTRLGEEALRGPDHPSLQLPARPDLPAPAFRVNRSGGFEGLGATPDGSRLWALLEQPLFDPTARAPEGFLRLLELDPARRDWTGRTLRLQLGEGTVAIGDLNFIDATRALVIERDNGEGDPSLACGTAPPSAACFHNPARAKRVVLIDLGAPDAEGFVRRLGHIDLMDIRDPRGVARARGDRGPDVPAERFSFPFFTIENVHAADADHIIVANDNNLPFSADRHLTRADDNEFILLRVPELLRAR